MSGPRTSRLKLLVLGQGEISTTYAVECSWGGPDRWLRPYPGTSFTLTRPGTGRSVELPRSQVAFKRMPLFDTAEQVERYRRAFDDYHELLAAAGLEVAAYGLRVLRRPDGKLQVYDLQARLPADSIGHVVLRGLDADGARRAVRAVFLEMAKLWAFNAAGAQAGHPPFMDLRVALDGQISNWAFLPPEGGGGPAAGTASAAATDFTPGRVVYLDTSTPLYRLGGREALDAGLFIASLPRPLRWLIRRFFLQDVLDRYYDLRSVVLDLVANVIKEGRPDLVPALVEEANAFLAAAGGVSPSPSTVRPLTVREVRYYYRQDRLIWFVFQNSRRIARALRSLIGRPLDYRLPPHRP